MKLFLFGGAEPNAEAVSALILLMNTVLEKVQPKQLLHIPYARTQVPDGEIGFWGEGWVSRGFNLQDIELLDARSEVDLKKADQPFIFMNGGHQRDELYTQIVSNQRLRELVVHAEFLMGESAGAMVCGEYRRTVRDGQEMIVEGLGFVKDTLIEPHYKEKNRYQLLRDEMRFAQANYGFGIDSGVGVLIDTANYPKSYQMVGSGVVEFLELKNLDK